MTTQVKKAELKISIENEGCVHCNVFVESMYIMKTRQLNVSKVNVTNILKPAFVMERFLPHLSLNGE